jgi:hypothetical protein
MHIYEVTTYALLLAYICLGHSCDHLQGVSQYKYQEKDRNPIKCIIEFAKILPVINTVQNLLILLFQIW